MQKKLFVVLFTLGALTLAGCGRGSSNLDNVPTLEADKIADFSEGEAEEIFASDGWSNGQPFNAVWKKENISYSNGQMHLSIKGEEATADEVTYPYTAGEARSHKLYGYGDFEVRMKPTNVRGSVSTFFTYTDKWNTVGGVENKHDEIDIEFLGKTPTKVQFNYFVGGQGDHEYLYNLGFDASEEFHNYGFRWEKNAITWFIDGKAVYQVKGDENTLPSQNGRIMTSYWPSSATAWSGKFDGPTADTVDYEWIKASGETIYADGEEPVEPPTDTINWDEITPTTVNFSASRQYTVTANEGVTTVTYEEAGGWANIVGTGVEAIANQADAVNLTLKNNSTLESIIRVDVQGTTQVGNTDCLNTSAFAEGHDEIYTDTNWGGSKFTLAAGEEVEFIIHYDVTTERGLAKMLLLFIDSLDDAVKPHAGGNIQISKVKFANTSGEPIVPPEPIDPPVDESVELSFWTSTDLYTLDPANTATKSVRVTYTAISGTGYAPFGAGYAAANKASFSLNIKNEGEAAVQLRVDITGTTTVGNTKALNTNAYALSGEHSEIYTNIEWGGSYILVAAAEEVTFVVEFDQTTDKGAMTGISLFADSSRGEDATFAGNIVLSNFIFGDAEVVVEGQELSFWTAGVAVIDPSNTLTKVLNVTYSNVSGSSYSPFGTGYTDADKTSFSFTVKNNGSAEVAFRVDILGTTTVGNTNDINTAATAEGHNEISTNLEWGGSSLLIAAHEVVTIVVTFDQLTERGAMTGINFFADSARGDANTYSGNLTLSGFIFA